jgi:hypothetical protein
MPLGKVAQRGLLYGSPAQLKDKSAIVHNCPITHVDTVMCIAQPRGNQVRPYSGLFMGCKKTVALAKACQAPLARPVCTAGHGATR